MNGSVWHQQNTVAVRDEVSSILFTPTGDLRRDISQLLGEDRPTGRPTFEQQLNAQFLRICGITSRSSQRSDKDGSHENPNVMQDILTGLYAEGQPYIYLILSDNNEVKVHLSLPCASNSHLAKLLCATFRVISLTEIPSSTLVTSLQNLSYCATMQGIPSPGEAEGELDRLLFGLFGNRWAYVVMAWPADRERIAATLDCLAQESQRVKNTYLRPSTVELDNNPLAQYYLELLKGAFDQYKIGRTQGCWETRVFLLSESEAVLSHGMALLASIFCHDKSLPSPIRLYPCLSGEPSIIRPTLLNTPQLSLLTQLPSEEMPGYQKKPLVSFATALPKPHAPKTVAIGKVLQWDTPTGDWLEINPVDLTKHALITGVTGSGKTETCQFLLDQLWREHSIPYLVIEPAKKEYRDLHYIKGHDGLKVFTLGDKRGAPFYLNPFEISEGVHVQMHIDSLRSLFNASFAGLYAPMPYILEEALYKVYQKRGWDLASGKSMAERAFPTLSDFCMEVEETVRCSGYDPEITQNVASALRVRLNSLRLGAKGLMLDVAKSTPFEGLMTVPTVLELASAGDAEVTAFIMGLVMIRLYEHLAQNKSGAALKHVTLIEEAHRLLTGGFENHGNVEVSNARGQAVEAFCNMLAEVRAYGEGFIIVDQSPTKLHPDAIKGTNLKVIHRLVAEDDRQAMAGSTTMDENQKTFLATLSTGEAVVYAEGFHRPYLVRIPAFRRYAIEVRRPNQTQYMNV